MLFGFAPVMSSRSEPQFAQNARWASRIRTSRPRPSPGSGGIHSQSRTGPSGRARRSRSRWKSGGTALTPGSRLNDGPWLAWVLRVGVRFLMSSPAFTRQETLRPRLDHNHRKARRRTRGSRVVASGNCAPDTTFPCRSGVVGRRRRRGKPVSRPPLLGSVEANRQQIYFKSPVTSNAPGERHDGLYPLLAFEALAESRVNVPTDLQLTDLRGRMNLSSAGCSFSCPRVSWNQPASGVKEWSIVVDASVRNSVA